MKKVKVSITITHNAELWSTDKKNFKIIKQPIVIEVINIAALNSYFSTYPPKEQEKIYLEKIYLKRDIPALQDYIKTFKQKYNVIRIKTIVQEKEPKASGCPIDEYDSQILEHF